jgi:hypothetical protein
LNIATKEEANFNVEFKIEMIKEIIYDAEEQNFMILANKFDEKLGFFICKMSEKDPEDIKFLIKWKNKLDIGDTTMYILRNFNTGLKELIVSFKTIYINTYNVVCMDISVDDEHLMIFRHESF